MWDRRIDRQTDGRTDKRTITCSKEKCAVTNKAQNSINIVLTGPNNIFLKHQNGFLGVLKFYNDLMFTFIGLRTSTSETCLFTESYISKIY